jgi:predicted N-acetyltransferase YhbS
MKHITQFDPGSAVDWAAVAAVWNGALGDRLAISPAFVQFNTQPIPGYAKSGWLCWADEDVVAFALASASGDVGWIDGIGVLPGWQGQGLGSALMARAEGWLAEQGCASVQLGGGVPPFVPGLPLELDQAEFFHKRGYRPSYGDGKVWDVARDLADYPQGVTARMPVLTPGCRLALATPGDAEALRTFLAREFPDRWLLEYELFLAARGEMSGYLLLWREEEGGPAWVDGFCRLRWEGCGEPLDRFYHHGLHRPWGQLGPIGVGQASRGQGLGGALLHAGLEQLQTLGVRGCVIDWTDLVTFYAKFGFTPWRGYQMLAARRPTEE